MKARQYIRSNTEYADVKIKMESTFYNCFTTHLKKKPVFKVAERRLPERANVHPAYLRGLHHLPQRPHQGTVHAHQLLRVNRVGLVQKHSCGDQLSHPPKVG